MLQEIFILKMVRLTPSTEYCFARVAAKLIAFDRSANVYATKVIEKIFIKLVFVNFMWSAALSRGNSSAMSLISDPLLFIISLIITGFVLFLLVYYVSFSVDNLINFSFNISLNKAYEMQNERLDVQDARDFFYNKDYVGIGSNEISLK